MSAHRVAPVEKPFPEPIRGFIEFLPLKLFRTFAHNVAMTEALQGWGGYLLDRRANSLPSRVRELVISRVCGRCGCEYEWGVHAMSYGSKVGISDEQMASAAVGSPNDDCWSDDDRLVLSLVDQLHDTSHVDDDLFQALSTSFEVDQIIEMMMLAGWYHAICYTANGLRVTNEDGAPTFPEPTA